VHLRSHYHPDRGETEKEFKRSIELNNNYALAHLWYAGYLAMMGRFDEALLEMKQAQKLDPLSPAINNVEAKILYLSRQYDESISKCLEVLELDPNFVPARVLLGFVYLGKQMYEEALREFKETIELSSGFFEFQDIEDKHSFSEFQKRLFSSGGDPELIAGIGYIYAVTGKRNEALEIVEGLEYLSKCMYIESDFIAIIYSTLGDKDKAFEWLDKAFADKSVTLRYLKVWSLFDSLRPDPRFEDLQRRMNLTS
jgi:tetratricopeptide (TPR) repeat protein